MTLRCRSTSVPVGTTAATPSMLGESRASGPDCLKEVSGTSVRYGTGAHILTYPRVGTVCYTLYVSVSVCVAYPQQEGHPRGAAVSPFRKTCASVRHQPA